MSARLDPDIARCRAERRRVDRKRARETAPLMRAAKREFDAQSERWKSTRRSKNTPKGIKRTTP